MLLLTVSVTHEGGKGGSALRKGVGRKFCKAITPKMWARTQLIILSKKLPTIHFFLPLWRWFVFVVLLRVRWLYKRQQWKNASNSKADYIITIFDDFWELLISDNLGRRNKENIPMATNCFHFLVSLERIHHSYESRVDFCFDRRGNFYFIYVRQDKCLKGQFAKLWPARVFSFRTFLLAY